MAVGIIAEYNPFHNGHLYHLNKVKEMFPDEEIVLVMSSSFTQRGEPSITSKWKKKDIALEAGIDLVIELPYVFSTEGADFFSYGAITLLEKLKVEKLVFGSESNDISLLELIVDTELNNPDFEPLVKMYMKLGENYPTALSKAILDLSGKKVDLPNDLLGISYIKTIKKNNYKIKPYSIKRTNDYNDTDLSSDISSAKAIREALKNKTDIKNNIPSFVRPYLNNPIFLDDYFKFLKYKILTEENLEKYQSVDEGLGDKIKKEILNSSSYDELINNIKSKRYTYNRLGRMLNHILVGFTKEQKEKCLEVEYIRVLGFNKKGQDYLNRIKKDLDIRLISNFSKTKSVSLDVEFLASSVYASVFDEKDKNTFIKNEYIYHPKYKEDNNE